jgi:hypothetical protein
LAKQFINENKMSTKNLIFTIILFAQAQLVNAAICMPVDGLSFEKIDNNNLLVIKNGKNIGIMKISRSLPSKISQFRFFTDKICDCSCPEEKFHIDGELFSISRIDLYSQ